MNMKTTSVQNILYYNKAYLGKQNAVKNNFIQEPPDLKPVNYYNPISFGRLGGMAKKLKGTYSYIKAEKNLKTQIKNLKKYNSKIDFLNLNLDKLEGIQEGIKVFEGLSIKEIAFLYKDLINILAYRGCSNRCAHCYANAIPLHIPKKDKSMIKKMAVEDFKLLVNGMQELNKRLGFDPLSDQKFSMSFFEDADSIELEMIDKTGKIYDFVDIYEIFKGTTKHKILFDTSGWTPKNQKYQLRAEKLVKYLSENDSGNLKVSISLNPFHALNVKSQEFIQSGDLENAAKYKEFYTERMANAIFTFTPLLMKNKLDFIVRSMGRSTEVPGFGKENLRELLNDIFKNVEEKYIKDYNSNRKYIKNEIQMEELLERMKAKCLRFASIKPFGRARILFNKRPGLSGNVYYPNEIPANILEFINYQKKEHNNIKKILDVNGKIYITDFEFTLPTEIQLNFENKAKHVPPLGNLVDDFTITKKMIKENFEDLID